MEAPPTTAAADDVNWVHGKWDGKQWVKINKKAFSDPYPPDPRVYFQPPEVKELRETVIQKYWLEAMGAIGGFSSFCVSNGVLKRPLLTGIQKHLIAAAAGYYVASQLHNYFRVSNGRRDAAIRHYIKLHPEDFPIPVSVVRLRDSHVEIDPEREEIEIENSERNVDIVEDESFDKNGDSPRGEKRKRVDSGESEPEIERGDEGQESVETSDKEKYVHVFQEEWLKTLGPKTFDNMCVLICFLKFSSLQYTNDPNAGFPLKSHPPNPK
ncbi:hypothetical protein GQR58_002924 [Nymphon striatum]|nr:hypothetical protein GQR58_002924 [Nymphon striatum]